MVLTLHVEHLSLWRTTTQDHIMVWGWLTIPSPSWLPSTIIIIFMNSHPRSHYGLGMTIIIALWEKHYQFQEPYLHDHLKVQVKSLINIDPNPNNFLSIVSWSRKWCKFKLVWKWEKGHNRMWQQWFLFCQEWKRWLAIRASELISNFLHGLGIGGAGGGDHLELEPRIFATLHFTKKGPLCSKFYIIRFCSEFPVFLYVCLKNKKKWNCQIFLKFSFWSPQQEEGMNSGLCL